MLAIFAVAGLLGAEPVAAADGDSPAQLFAALRKEYSRASVAYRAAETDLQRKAAVEAMGEFAPRYLDLAEKHPDAPLALEIIRQAVQIINSTESLALTTSETNRAEFAEVNMRDPARKAVKLLREHHIKSEKLGRVCDRMRYGYRKEYEAFLFAAIESNPHRNVQALASLYLAQYLKDRLGMVRLAADRPDLAAQLERMLGKEYLGERKSARGRGLEDEIERLLERATTFDKVELVSGGKVAEKAELELYEMRQLAVGKQAPETGGQDQDGKSFELGDYRGKVVLLYFWSEF